MYQVRLSWAPFQLSIHYKVHYTTYSWRRNNLIIYLVSAGGCREKRSLLRRSSKIMKKKRSCQSVTFFFQESKTAYYKCTLWQFFAQLALSRTKVRYRQWYCSLKYWKITHVSRVLNRFSTIMYTVNWPT